jgi:hypothetical protein
LNGSTLSCWRREALTDFLPLGRSRNTLSTRATTDLFEAMKQIAETGHGPV